MTLSFVELPGFTAESLSVASDEELRHFQNEPAADREAGDLIQHTGGLRKARFRLAGRGKSGSARVIHLRLPHVGALIFFHFYTKQAKSSLSAADKRALRTATQLIKQCYQP